MDKFKNNKFYILQLIFLVLILCSSTIYSATNSIIGTDEDNNGIRDDVQIAIEKTYSDNETARKALFQYARYLQNALKSYEAKTLKDNIDNLTSEFQRATLCIKKRFIDPDFKILFVKFITINNDERVKAYYAIEGNFAGVIFESIDEENVCNN